MTTWSNRIYTYYVVVVFILTFAILFPLFLCCIWNPSWNKYGRKINQYWAKGFFSLIFLPVKVEVEGTNSYEELSASAVIVRSLGDNRNVVIVTDPYHAYRVDKIAHEVGLRPHVSPTSGGATMSQYVRETLAVSLGRIVSFRRLASWR